VGEIECLGCFVQARVLQAYRALGVDVRDLSHDQNTTDLEKALQAASQSGCKRIIVAGQFAGVAGRLDHTFGIANALHRHTDLQIAVVGNDSFMCLLRSGEHRLLVPRAELRPHCGLVPLGEPCKRISTKGLQWDMEDSSMEFGGDVSVCNRVHPSQGGVVQVKTESPVLWMCTLPRSEVALSQSVASKIQHSSGPANGVAQTKAPMVYNLGVIVPAFVLECLQATGAPLWEAFHEHPFVQQATSGELDPLCFEHYQNEEVAFSSAYADAAALLAIQCGDRGDKEFFLRSARSCLNAVDGIRGELRHSANFEHEPFQQRDQTTMTTDAFTDFLRVSSTKAEHPVEVAAALAPTVLLYIEGGFRVLEKLGGRVPDDHRYAAWLRLYTDPSWLEYCNEFLARLQRLASEASDSQRDSARQLFLQCVEHEVDFWQQAVDRPRQPVKS